MVINNNENEYNKKIYARSIYWKRLSIFLLSTIFFSLFLILMSSSRLDTPFNSLTITSTSSVSTRTTTTTKRRSFDVDPHRFSIVNPVNTNVSGVSIHQRRTSVVNHHQRRNSQLRKTSFTTSTLVCVTKYN